MVEIRRIWSFLTKEAVQLQVRGWTPSLWNYSVSRTLQRSSFTIFPNSAMTSTGFLLRPASDSRRWCRPSRPSTELHPSTLLQTTRPSKSTSLFYISGPAGTAIAESNQSPLSATVLFWHLSGGTISKPESLSIFRKRLICSDFTSTPLSMTATPPPKKAIPNVNVNLKNPRVKPSRSSSVAEWKSSRRCTPASYDMTQLHFWRDLARQMDLL